MNTLADLANIATIISLIISIISLIVSGIAIKIAVNVKIAKNKDSNTISDSTIKDSIVSQSKGR